MSRNQDQMAEHFLALLRPIRRELEIYCRRLIWNSADVPDALQNAVMKAFRAFDRYHDDSNFRAWIFKILTNEVLKLSLKYGRIAEAEFQVEPDELAEAAVLEESVVYRDWLNAPEALADSLDEKLVAALKTLTETERAVLLLRAIGDFSYREIADALEIPLGSVMGNLARARKKMREAILRSKRRSVL